MSDTDKSCFSSIVWRLDSYDLPCVQNVALTSSLLSADGRREGGGGGKSARALPFKMRPSSSLG